MSTMPITVPIASLGNHELIEDTDKLYCEYLASLSDDELIKYIDTLYHERPEHFGAAKAPSTGDEQSFLCGELHKRPALCETLAAEGISTVNLGIKYRDGVFEFIDIRGYTPCCRLDGFAKALAEIEKERDEEN